MSSPPTFIKRTKSKTIRAKGSNPAVPDENENNHVVSNFKNKAKTRNKPAQRLSFDVGDDKEDDVFQVKKSNLSRRVKIGIGASPMASPGVTLSSKLETTTLSNTNRASAPKYDTAYLNELRASTNVRPNLSSVHDEDAMDVDQLTFDASEMEGAVIENVEDDALIPSRIGNVAETIIPTESIVKAAKEKRELGRKTGVAQSGEEEYISLDVTRRDDIYAGPHPESRLMREDDDLGEGDDDDADFTGAKERIALSKKGRKEEEKKRKKGIVELIEEADEQDEETMEWELAQVKRAVPAEANAAPEVAQKVYKPQPIPTPTPIPTLDASILRLDRLLSTLNASHAQSATAIASLAEEHLKWDEEEVQLRRNVQEKEEMRAWFGAFHDRMEEVGEFLEEKFPVLEKLEAEHVSLLTERREMIEKRRMDDNEDDLVLLFGVPPDMMQGEAEGVDELGRALPEATHPQSSLRRERRNSRATRHFAANADHQSNSGYSTDSALSPSDLQDFQIALNSLKDKIQSILFSDVKAKAFKDPKHGIMIWFKDWREKYPGEYSNAFGGMGLVQAWEFWARTELLGWLPLENEPRLDEFKWYSRLHEYSHPEGDYEEEEGLRPEDDLPAQMVGTMLVPRLNVLILGGALDPYSRRQIPTLIDLAEQIEATLGSDHARFGSLLSTVARVFRKSATELIEEYRRFSTGSQVLNGRGTFDPESILARQRFMRRIQKLVEGVMRWRRYTKERDGLGILVSDLVKVLEEVALPGWDVGGEDIVRKVVGTLPAELVPISISNRLT